MVFPLCIETQGIGLVSFCILKLERQQEHGRWSLNVSVLRGKCFAAFTGAALAPPSATGDPRVAGVTTLRIFCYQKGILQFQRFFNLAVQ